MAAQPPQSAGSGSGSPSSAGAAGSGSGSAGSGSGAASGVASSAGASGSSGAGAVSQVPQVFAQASSAVSAPFEFEALQGCSPSWSFSQMYAHVFFVLPP
jgi:hypothetical protein